MSHRVISGSAKGKRLKLVPGNTTRPITDRAKEALFNIIGSDIYDAYWLDLFAGTGAVGIEALSRGAEFVLFNDMERLAITTIEDNLKTTGLAANAKIMRKDAFALL
ncbi:MAG: RsmD family RNA methyltransferase, partial [Chloroflexota bacterium]